jgi:hypothetical protein
MVTRDTSYYPPETYTIDELLKKQSKGKFLNPDEKRRVQRYASNARVRNKNKR